MSTKSPFEFCSRVGNSQRLCCSQKAGVKCLMNVLKLSGILEKINPNSKKLVI